MRRAAKVDANQPEIVSALRSAGASVQPLHVVGKGCPDLIVGYERVNYLLELKDGRLVPSARRLTADEHDWHSRWRGQVIVVNSINEALQAVGIDPFAVKGAMHPFEE